jgi:phosphatidylglycerophosphatase A
MGAGNVELIRATQFPTRSGGKKFSTFGLTYDNLRPTNAMNPNEREPDSSQIRGGRPASPLRERLAVCWATGLGIGLISPAPGTVGTAVWGLPFAWAIGQLAGVGWEIAAIAVAFVVGIPITTAANRALGSEKDNQAIIWDEIATLPVVFLWAPMANWKVALAGLALHRLFDITKPPPARQLERLPAGLGIMADDLMAAIYAGAGLVVLGYADNSMRWNLLAVVGG